MQLEVKFLSYVRLFAIPWTVAYQAPPSMEFSSPKTFHAGTSKTGKIHFDVCVH